MHRYWRRRRGKAAAKWIPFVERYRLSQSLNRECNSKGYFIMGMYFRLFSMWK
jgi:hypothetical protein